MPKKLQKGLEVRHFPGSVGEVLWGSEIVSKGVCRKGLVELSQGGHFPASVQEVLWGLERSQEGSVVRVSWRFPR